MPEIVMGGLNNVDPRKPATLAGASIHVAADGTKTVVAGNGLVGPSGMAIGTDGTIYVSNFGVFPGKGEGVKVTV